MNQNKKSILLVDDDETVLKALGRYLDSKGYKVETAKTGREAIQKSQKDFFNIAILDIKLPDMSGTEVLATLDNSEPEMKKIMLTGYPDLVEGNVIITNRADAYLMKPVEPSRLAQLIEQKLVEQAQELEEERKKTVKAVQNENKKQDINQNRSDKTTQNTRPEYLDRYE